MSQPKRELNFNPSDLSASTADYVARRPVLGARVFAYLIWLVLALAACAAMWAGSS